MFTGIIEAIGIIKGKREHDLCLDLVVEAPFVDELKVDQSIAHNGCCLTVVAIDGQNYTVTAIPETLRKTNLSKLHVGDLVNLERCLKASGRFDGHIVQGHVDQIGICVEVKEEGGSHLFRFSYDAALGNITVEKGSIAINGISLTVVDSGYDHFSVAIIPYTYEHTNLKQIRPGDLVNLEFDIVGKYLKKMFPK